jgi:threonine dehydratase
LAASAVALAAALFHGDELEDGPVIATASGGNVDAEVFAEILRAYPL